MINEEHRELKNSNADSAALHAKTAESDYSNFDNLESEKASEKSQFDSQIFKVGSETVDLKGIIFLIRF
jgi:hypothetical protein